MELSTDQRTTRSHSSARAKQRQSTTESSPRVDDALLEVLLKGLLDDTPVQNTASSPQSATASLTDQPTKPTTADDNEHHSASDDAHVESDSSVEVSSSLAAPLDAENFAAAQAAALGLRPRRAAAIAAAELSKVIASGSNTATKGLSSTKKRKANLKSRTSRNTIPKRTVPAVQNPAVALDEPTVEPTIITIELPTMEECPQPATTAARMQTRKRVKKATRVGKETPMNGKDKSVEEAETKLLCAAPDCSFVAASDRGLSCHYRWKHPDMLCASTGTQSLEIVARRERESPTKSGSKSKKSVNSHKQQETSQSSQGVDSSRSMENSNDILKQRLNIYLARSNSENGHPGREHPADVIRLPNLTVLGRDARKNALLWTYAEHDLAECFQRLAHTARLCDSSLLACLRPFSKSMILSGKEDIAVITDVGERLFAFLQRKQRADESALPACPPLLDLDTRQYTSQLRIASAIVSLLKPFQEHFSDSLLLEFIQCCILADSQASAETQLRSCVTRKAVATVCTALLDLYCVCIPVIAGDTCPELPTWMREALERLRMLPSECTHDVLRPLDLESSSDRYEAVHRASPLTWSPSQSGEARSYSPHHPQRRDSLRLSSSLHHTRDSPHPLDASLVSYQTDERLSHEYSSSVGRYTTLPASSGLVSIPLSPHEEGDVLQKRLWSDMSGDHTFSFLS